MNKTTTTHDVLDPCYYTDPAIFAQEKTQLFARTWQFAGHASQLKQIGDYFCFELAGESLFCVMSNQHQIQTFYNVCQHRAHQLVHGHGNSRVLVCPYHGWTYELSGQLRSGPNVRAVPGFNAAEICLTEVRTELFCGFIFVNLDPAAKPMDEWFPKVRKQISDFVPDIERLQPLEWIHVDERCNWKVSIENYSECYHCRRCHPTFASGVIKPETYDIQPQGYCLRHTTQCQNLEKMSYSIDIQANAYAGSYSSWFLWPMFSFQVYPGNVLNTYHWRAEAVDRVIVWRGWYSIDGQPSTTIKNLAAQDRATTVEEDIHLVESVQRGLNSRGYRPGPLVIDPRGGVDSEHSVQALRSWLIEALA